jgi:hypothetical protein
VWNSGGVKLTHSNECAIGVSLSCAKNSFSNHSSATLASDKVTTITCINITTAIILTILPNDDTEFHKAYPSA